MIRNGLNIPIAEVDGLVAALPGRRAVRGLRRRPTTRPASGSPWRCACATGAALDVRRDGRRAWWPPALAKWKIPEELVVWDEPFPETASGKVQRNLLEERGAGRPRTLAPRLR